MQGIYVHMKIHFPPKIINIYIYMNKVVHWKSKPPLSATQVLFAFDSRVPAAHTCNCSSVLISNMLIFVVRFCWDSQ